MLERSLIGAGVGVRRRSNARGVADRVLLARARPEDIGLQDQDWSEGAAGRGGRELIRAGYFVLHFLPYRINEKPCSHL